MLHKHSYLVIKYKITSILIYATAKHTSCNIHHGHLKKPRVFVLYHIVAILQFYNTRMNILGIPTFLIYEKLWQKLGQVFFYF